MEDPTPDGEPETTAPVRAIALALAELIGSSPCEWCVIGRVWPTLTVQHDRVRYANGVARYCSQACRSAGVSAGLEGRKAHTREVLASL